MHNNTRTHVRAQKFFTKEKFMSSTFWAFVPALVAILLALITKQVYVSLFLGIFVGGMFLACGNPIEALGTTFTVMSEKVGANVSILAFLVVLGIIVVLMQKSGGSQAYGRWASKKIKSEKGALTATAALGCAIFVDDYFNCLTVGSVMKPLTDKYRVSRSKLAWIIDSTAAPVCIIAPISSWAAAVSGELEGNSLSVFMRTVPFNVYAILTIVMVFVFCIWKFNFGKMRKHEYIAKTTGDLNAGATDLPAEEKVEFKAKKKAKVQYLLIPVIILIVCCIGGMIYVGYFYNWGSSLDLSFARADVIGILTNADGSIVATLNNTPEILEMLGEAGANLGATGETYYYLINDLGQIELFVNSVTSVTWGETVAIFTEFQAEGLGTVPQVTSLIDAFSSCDAGLSLAIGSTVALIIIAVYYMAMKALSFKEITESFTQGFKAMVPAILILTFAWTLSGIMGAKGGYLDARGFVEGAPTGINLNWLFPAVFFALACGIAFATGTSWGTFGVLIPLSTAILGTEVTTLTIMTISATLGGAVFGDHISPISDTTILASAGANCNHVNHVNTQLPYAGLIAIISFIAYLVGGLALPLGGLASGLIIWGVALILFGSALLVIKLIDKKKEPIPDFTPTDVEE